MFSVTLSPLQQSPSSVQAAFKKQKIDSLTSSSSFARMDKWSRILCTMLCWASHLAACSRAPLQPPKHCAWEHCHPLLSYWVPLCCEFLAAQKFLVVLCLSAARWCSHPCAARTLLLAWVTAGDSHAPHSDTCSSTSTHGTRVVTARQIRTGTDKSPGRGAVPQPKLCAPRRRQGGSTTPVRVSVAPCLHWLPGAGLSSSTFLFGNATLGRNSH